MTPLVDRNNLRLELGYKKRRYPLLSVGLRGTFGSQGTCLTRVRDRPIPTPGTHRPTSDPTQGFAVLRVASRIGSMKSAFDAPRELARVNPRSAGSSSGSFDEQPFAYREKNHGSRGWGMTVAAVGWGMTATGTRVDERCG
ncbi:hypothetical protein [Phormidium sp. CCY1219]|uniref:hypothetical protein n=1 Tax=Phormidium sp. CCY1219 TaxID=2886104 RepID=UPI002D1E4C00|nr:hypothetical protein [Phormidium sp. CCY1219]MEB3829666.1 hypothetical protein [Phormidium sp. CCY1219]